MTYLSGAGAPYCSGAGAPCCPGAGAPCCGMTAAHAAGPPAPLLWHGRDGCRGLWQTHAGPAARLGGGTVSASGIGVIRTHCVHRHMVDRW